MLLPTQLNYNIWIQILHLNICHPTPLQPSNPWTRVLSVVSKLEPKSPSIKKCFDFCQKHPEEPYVFDEFVRRYNILEGIRDIAAAWEAVPESTIVKSFAKIVPKDELERLGGGINDFEGFNNFEGLDEDLKSHIQDSVTLLNGCHPSVTFTKKDIIQDIFLNPGPADEYAENIIDDVLQSED